MSDWVEVNIDDVKTQTDKAYLVEKNKDLFWIPKSVFKVDTDGRRVLYFVRAWFYNKELSSVL